MTVQPSPGAPPPMAAALSPDHRDVPDPRSPLPQNAPREEWLDIARGIAIVLMVHGHVVFGLANARLVGDDWRYANYLIYCFHMAIFFIASGVPAARSLEKGAWAFLRPRMWTVVYPYFLWSTIQLSTKLAVGDAVNNPAQPADLLSIPWRPVEQYWFLYALALCQIFAVFVPRKLLAPAAAMMFVLSFYLPGGTGVQAAARFLPFYTAGILLSTLMIRWQPSAWWLFSWSGLLLFGSALWSMGYSYLSIEAMAAGIFGIVGTFTIAKRARGKWAAIVAWLGRVSMTIYVLHVFFGAGIRIALVKLGVSNPWLHYTAGMIAGLGLSVLAYMVFERLRMLPWLGLASWPKKDRYRIAPT